MQQDARGFPQTHVVSARLAGLLPLHVRSSAFTTMNTEHLRGDQADTADGELYSADDQGFLVHKQLLQLASPVLAGLFQLEGSHVVSLPASQVLWMLIDCSHA